MKKQTNCESKIFPWHIHLAQLYVLAQEYGIEKQDLLDAAGLTEPQLEDLTLNISWRQYRSMNQLVIDHGPSNWSLEFGKRLTLPTHGLLSLAIMNCNNFRQAVALLFEFKALVESIFYLKQKETAKYLIIELYPEFTRDYLLTKSLEVFFIIVYQSLLSICNFQEEIKNNTENFCIFLPGDPPPYLEEIQKFFNNNLKFNQNRAEMRISKRLLDLDLCAANPVTTHSLVTVLSAQLAQLPVIKGDLHVLHDAFREGIYTQEGCAKAFNISVPTLKRRLKLSFSTFSYELASFRHIEACYALEYESLSIDSIADKLGFQDVGSFRRAFKKLSGITPNEYRDRH